MDLTSPLPFRHQREAHMPKPLEIPVTVTVVPQTQRSTDSQPQPPTTIVNQPPTSSPPPLSSPPTVFLPPRQPLPPHKLANIANALGVNMPMPASYRSPSPSGGAAVRAPSRFLLHVVPPNFLPSDDEYDNRPDPTASSVSVASYRSQFRRGTLIPLYPTLNSQLGAIAREYGLPSTGGLVLYLVHTSSSQGGAADGPRISEEIWKLLWFRALQAERQDSQPRAPSSLTFRSGRSTPSSPLTGIGREFAQSYGTTPRTATGTYPYPSPSASSAPSSEVNLPLTDNETAVANELLNGISSDLTPNPFLPILAKVEFDIDLRKAPWYESWARAKRERTRLRSASAGQLPLRLADRARSQSRPRFLTERSTSDEESRSDYQLLDDGEGEKTAVDDDDDLLDQATVRLPLNGQDPLADVFGTDATTWSSLRQRNGGNRDLDLIIPPGSDPEMESGPPEEEEVLKLWNQNMRPTLPLSPPSISTRKAAPPPLNLVQHGHNATAVGPPSALGSAFDERKMKRRTGMVFGELEVKIVSEPEEMTPDESNSGDRSSQIMMKQKLDILEQQLAILSPRKLSSTPPPVPPVPDFDHNLSLRSAPPGIDKFNQDMSPSNLKYSKSVRSVGETPRTEDPSSLYATRKDSLPTSSLKAPRSNLKVHKRGEGSQSSSGSSLNPITPADPFVVSSNPKFITPQITTPPSIRQSGRTSDRSPPQLTLKRPTAPEPSRLSPNSAGQDILMPSIDPSSPVIPLSPDPFGKAPVEDLRHARGESTSTESRPPSRANGTILPSAVPENSPLDSQSSRFSADSEQGVEALSKQRRARSNSIMSVRSLRNLWRKSGTAGKGLPPPPPTPTEVSMMPPPTPGLPSPHPNSIPSHPKATVSPAVNKEEKRLSRDSRHSRAESHASVRSNRVTSAAPTERVRRPSTGPRPDSGADPFQFDNVHIYKSASSTSLPSTSLLQHAPSGNVSQSKGILKGYSGNPYPEPEIKRTHPLVRRTESVASIAVSDRSAGSSSVVMSERSGDSSTPSSPRANARLSKHSKSSVEPHPAFMSQSVPTSSVMSYSRYPDTLALQPISVSQTSSFLSFEDGATPRVADFEMIPANSSRSTPSASYAGEFRY